MIIKLLGLGIALTVGTTVLGIPKNWGAQESDKGLVLPVDRMIHNTDDVYWRVVDVNASASTVFRWLCQMKAAPYAYDWLDNFGVESPKELTPGLDNLKIGQHILGMFQIVDFVEGEYLTLRIEDVYRHGYWGDILIGYTMVPSGPQTTRLIVKMRLAYPKGPIGWLTRFTLPWGNFVMMRKQLLTFKELAERSP